MVLLCVTLASTGPGSLPRSRCPEAVAASSVAQNDPEHFQQELEAMLETVEGESCPAAVDLSSHPEDLFAESGELDWVCETEPGEVQERMAEDQTKKEAAREKEREKKTKKEEKKKAAKEKKDKKKKKKDKKEKKAAKDKKEPVVVPARVITLGALREELERYCPIQEITAQHENPRATDPHLRRPAIIAAIAERLGCSFTALTQWKTHILSWLEFRAAQSRCVRKPETEAEKRANKNAATAKATVDKKAKAEAKKKKTRQDRPRKTEETKRSGTSVAQKLPNRLLPEERRKLQLAG